MADSQPSTLSFDILQRQCSPAAPGGLSPPVAKSPVQEMLLEAERAGAMPAVRPLDDLFERGRRELRAASTRNPLPITAQQSSRCDLEQQLQQWRREADAKKRKGNTGLLVPPRMSLDQKDLFTSSFSSSFARERETRQADALSSDNLSLSLGAVHPEGLGAMGLATAASTSSLPPSGRLREHEIFTPPRAQQRAVSPLSVVWPSDGTVAQSALSRASEQSAGSPGQQEAAALRRHLANLQREIGDRERQLEELGEQERLLEEFCGEGDVVEVSNELQDWLWKEEEQVKELQAALSEVDSCIRESEEQLQFDQAQAQPLGAPSVASTAPTCQLSVEQVWQERAKALESDIRCEAAQALELQDRIHWLRTQLWRQPTPEDQRVVAINDLFEQIQGRLNDLSNGNTEVSSSETGMFLPSKPLMC